MLEQALSLLAGVALGLSLAAPPGPMNAIIAEESVLRGWRSGFRAGLGAMSADACFFVLALAGVVTVVQDAPVVRGALFGVGGLLMLYFAYGAATDANEAFGGEATASEVGDSEVADSATSESSAAASGAPDAAANGGAAGGAGGTGGADDGAAGGTDGRAAGGANGAGETPADEDSKGFRKAFVLALTNPYQILWWLTAGVSLLDPGTFAIDALGGLTVSTGSPVIVVGFFAGIAVWIAGFPAALVTAGRRVDSFAPMVAGLSAVVLALAGLSFLSEAVGVLV